MLLLSNQRLSNPGRAHKSKNFSIYKYKYKIILSIKQYIYKYMKKILRIFEQEEEEELTDFQKILALNKKKNQSLRRRVF